MLADELKPANSERLIAKRENHLHSSQPTNRTMDPEAQEEAMEGPEGAACCSSLRLAALDPAAAVSQSVSGDHTDITRRQHGGKRCRCCEPVTYR